MKELDEHPAKLLCLLKEAGIDAMPVRDETDQLVLFFEGEPTAKFLISVDPRVPTVWLQGVHDDQ